MDNILIIGRGAVVSAFAKKIKSCKDIGQIFIAPGNGVNSDIYQNVDIRENDLTGLLKFVLKNDIKFTVSLSNESLKSDIAGFFNENGQRIFAPTFSACKDFFNKVSVKKFLYKLHANPPRFCSFSKPQDIKDYLENTQYPVFISDTQYNELEEYSLVSSTCYSAQSFVNSLYKKGVTDILIEDFVYGKNFTLYFLTDGYTVLPFASTCCEKFDKHGCYSEIMESFTPNFYISEKLANEIQGIADNIINVLADKGSHYVGFLGIQGTIKDEGSFVVQNLKTTFDDIDSAAVLNSIDDDLYKLIQACVEGYFSDEYTEIKTNNLNFASIKINAKLCDFDVPEDINFIDNDNIILTKSAATLSRAKKYLEDDLISSKYFS